MNPKGASAAHHCRGSLFLAIFLILLHVHQEADNSVPRRGPERKFCTYTVKTFDFTKFLQYNSKTFTSHRTAPAFLAVPSSCGPAKQFSLRARTASAMRMSRDAVSRRRCMARSTTARYRKSTSRVRALWSTAISATMSSAISTRPSRSIGYRSITSRSSAR